MMLARILAVAALAAIVAGCESTSKTPAPPPTPSIPKPPPMQEAPPAYRAQLHADIAAGFYERGQMKVALEELEEAVKLDPKNAKIYNVYGLVYAVLGEDANAERNFQQAIALGPNDSEIRQNWGWYLCTHGKPRESIPEFEMAIRNPLYKSPDVALTNAGKCSIEYGDNRRGEDYLQARADDQSREHFRRVQPGTPHVPRVAHRRSTRADAARSWRRPIPRPTRSTSGCASSARRPIA